MNETLLTRRTFLKESGAAAAMAALPVERFAHAAGSDRLRVGMIGCGGRNAGAAAQALTADPGARLVAMCDLFGDRVQAKRDILRKEKPGRVEVKDEACFTGFDGYKHVIEASDVVLIANAAKFHPFHLMAAIQAGKHVFVEKPHAIDPVGIRMVEEACRLAEQKRLCIMSGLHSRHHEGYAETVRRIHEGAIGEVVAIEENFLRSPYGVVPRKAGLNEVEYQCSNQYHFNWLSGDDVVQSLVHNLDRATWVMQGETPIKAHGLGGRSTMTGEMYGNVFDHHSVIYEYARGVRLYAFCRTINSCYDEDSSIVLGTRGRASIKACRIDGERSWRWQGHCDPYQVEHNKLFAAIRAGTPITSKDYMARSTGVAIMGQIACYMGKEVTWDQLQGSSFQYKPLPSECAFDMEPPVKLASDGTYPVFKPGEARLV